MRIIFFVIIGIILLVSIFFLVHEPKVKNNISYQGPVPQGYDEQHFRETGETIKNIEVKIDG